MLSLYLCLFRCFGASDFKGETFVGVECHLPVVLPFGECCRGHVVRSVHLESVLMVWYMTQSSANSLTVDEMP